MDPHPTASVPPGPRTDVTPPDTALAQQAAVQSLGNWIGGVPINLGKSYKVVAISAVVALVALAATVGSVLAGGVGGVIAAILLGLVTFVAGAISIASLVDTVRTSGRPAHVYERGMALPDGKGWYVVAWMTGRIEPGGASYTPDGILVGEAITWTIGNLGTDDYNSMIEPDAGLTALYQHALAQIAVYQRDTTVNDLRAGRTVTFGDLTLGPDQYRGSQSAGAWATASRVWWSPEDAQLVVEQITPNGPMSQPVTGTADSVPNLALVIEVMRAMTGNSLR